MFTFIAGLVMGTGSTITIKVVYELNATGSDGHNRKFEKPLFTTWIMFLAMTFAVPLHFLWQYLSPRLSHWLSCRGGICCCKGIDDGFDDAYRTPAMGVSNAKPLLSAVNRFSDQIARLFNAGPTFNLAPLAGFKVFIMREKVGNFQSY